jgi:23S rRNA pseudouridine1911/1915/1917 synthase
VKKIIFLVSALDSGKRLDVMLAEQQSLLTRSQAQKAIKDHRVWVNQLVQKASYHVRSGEQVEVALTESVPSISQPEPLPLDIVYEDQSLVVVHKPAGMVVHPACGNYTGTLVNALLYHCKNLSGIGGVLRPGIVHRLDKGTSGIMVVAKNDPAHQELSGQFKEHSIRRHYQAIVCGTMAQNTGTIKTLIGRHPIDRKRMSTAPRKGRQAITHWEVKESFPGMTLLEVRLETGRTHQVRVHLASLGHPIVGDSVYGGTKRLKELPAHTLRQVIRSISRPLLHAGYLQFIHPETGAAMEFAVPPPADFMKVIELLRAAG